MKHKVSISIDEDTLIEVKAGIASGKFRNTSHAFEYAIKRLRGEEK